MTRHCNEASLHFRKTADDIAVQDLIMLRERSAFNSKEKLARMANQIALFFGTAMPHDEAIAGIADHLNKFWEPRMRRELLGMVASGSCGLSPMVIEAAVRVRVPPERETWQRTSGSMPNDHSLQ